MAVKWNFCSPITQHTAWDRLLKASFLSRALTPPKQHGRGLQAATPVHLLGIRGLRGWQPRGVGGGWEVRKGSRTREGAGLGCLFLWLH